MDIAVQDGLDHSTHSTTVPTAAWLCAEMLDVAQKACQAGDYNFAVEIYSSQLADLQQPDRPLCLLKADALSRAGRIGEALDSYCAAAKLDSLKPQELGSLVDCITNTLREKELCISAPSKTSSCRVGVNKNELNRSCSEDDLSEDEEPLDFFSCHFCKCLLTEPVTLECGHTYCKYCLEDNHVTECKLCRYKLSNSTGKVKPTAFKVNVVLSSLLEKWFVAESQARRYWLEGERLRTKHDFLNALERYNKAVEMAPTIARLLERRAELHQEMGNFRLALQDGDSMCQLKPLWPTAHYVRALALSKAGRNEETLKEYFYCVALKPNCITIRLEAQKLLSDMFSSLFEKDSLTALLHPCQTGFASPLKPASLLLGSLNSAPQKESQTEGPSDVTAKPQTCAGDSKNLGLVLSALLCTSGLKRKCQDNPPNLATANKLPRKDEGCSSSQAPVAHSGEREVPTHLLDSTDMECSLCMRLFYEPVTTPCGHTFCLKCLERCLDHNPNCPLCKENLAEYLASRGNQKTLLVEEMLQCYLSEALAERRKVHEEEMKELSNLKQEVPIFICTVAFPTIPCPLHIYEPCYRLMVRRSMETGTRQFGMCIADDLKGFADYGCMLEVKDVKAFPDGRSVVDTVGVSRFRVLSHGQRDGYSTAKIELLEDKKVEGAELEKLQKLHDSVYEQATSWFTSLKDNMKSQILSHFGQLPGKEADIQASPSGPAWCWWLLAVLPLEKRAQLSILSMTAFRDRLGAVRRVILLVTRKRQAR
ncbi:LON peptidase N-terminal domain and RING finger protein 2 [Osmerus eperlanus]|uniref:LON peptidase N-terminal domain and RING finger protein 2 n=1 Tax=Osmerus eperlanus TaxID=29151 RepID=UPI002E127348